MMHFRHSRNGLGNNPKGSVCGAGAVKEAWVIIMHHGLLTLMMFPYILGNVR